MARARDYLAPEAVDNLAQFLSFHAPAEKLIRIHDEAVAQLFERCKAFQEALERSPDLVGLYEKISAECEGTLGTEISAYFVSYPERQPRLGVLAEYIVNNLGELPPYYVTAPVWNHYLTEFDSLRTLPRFSAFDQATKEAGAALARANEALETGLRAIRSDLSVEHDVAIAEISRAV